MSTSPSDKVLIIGAGPVGLTLAAECLKHGVPFRIVDQNATHSQYSKALAIWSNTLEHLAGLGLAETFLRAGRPINKAVFRDAGKIMAEIPITEGLDSAYPQPLILPQSETEKLLIEHLTQHGVTIERNVKCIDLRQKTDRVEVDLEGLSGKVHTMEAAWVAGCDGARSMVRHKLPVEFPGVTEKMAFILADARIDGALPIDAMTISSSSEGNVIVFPVKEGIWRFFALREDDGNQAPPTLAEIQDHLDRAGLKDIRLHDPEWLSHFAVNERVASRNRVGRVFLLGDASHIHSPAGGQGMNTGMQDAFNLGWKLKLLSLGHPLAQDIAESYYLERHPVAEEVVEETGRLLHFGVQNHAFVRAARRLLLPLASKMDIVKHSAAHKLSELGISYKPGPLVATDSRTLHGELKPGTLARDAAIWVEDKKVSLWRELLIPQVTLLIFSGREGTSDEVHALLTSAQSVGVRLAYIRSENVPDPSGPSSWEDRGNAAHERYGIGDRAAWYLIRPDQYIAARGTVQEVELLRHHLATVT